MKRRMPRRTRRDERISEAFFEAVNNPRPPELPYIVMRVDNGYPLRDNDGF